MNYEALRNEMKEIVEISLSVPEQFQQRCFEILLNAYLAKKPDEPAVIESKDPVTPPPQNPIGMSTIPLTTQLRLFTQRTNVTMEMLNRIVLYSDGEIHFIKEPASQSIRQGQIDWALLLALKSIILKDNLEVDPEDVRSICKEKGFYDATNFAKNFRATPYADYFKGILEPQGNPQSLSSEGQTALAELLKGLVG